MKGIFGELSFLMLVGVIAMITMVIAFLYLKVHVTGVAVDTDSINRYEEVATTVLSAPVFVDDPTKITQFGPKNPDTRDKKTINCFQGDGPEGAHSNVNTEVCTKYLSFFYSKFKDMNGQPVMSSPGYIVRDPKNQYAFLGFIDNLKTSLPSDCYSLSFEDKGASADALTPPNSQCNLALPKLSKTYPIPVFLLAGPDVLDQVLKIGNTITKSDNLLVTWPKYGTNFAWTPGSAASGGGTP